MYFPMYLPIMLWSWSSSDNIHKHSHEVDRPWYHIVALMPAVCQSYKVVTGSYGVKSWSRAPSCLRVAFGWPSVQRSLGLSLHAWRSRHPC